MSTSRRFISRGQFPSCLRTNPRSSLLTRHGFNISKDQWQKMADNTPKQPITIPARSSIDSRPYPITSRTPSGGRLGPAPSPSPSTSHRQSFTDQLRGMPPSPRTNRHLSFSQAQMQELLNNPPTAGSADPAFAGRDWQHINVGELVNPKDLRFVELDTSVEDATNVGIQMS